MERGLQTSWNERGNAEKENWPVRKLCIRLLEGRAISLHRVAGSNTWGNGWTHRNAYQKEIRSEAGEFLWRFTSLPIAGCVNLAPASRGNIVPHYSERFAFSMYAMWLRTNEWHWFADKQRGIQCCRSEVPWAHPAGGKVSAVRTTGGSGGHRWDRRQQGRHCRNHEGVQWHNIFGKRCLVPEQWNQRN